MLCRLSLRNFVAVTFAVASLLLATPRADAGCALTDWLFGYGETAYTPAYPGTPMCAQGGAGACVPAACGCAPATCAPACGCQPMVPQTNYRPIDSLPITRPVPVVAYLPVNGVDPATGCAVTSYQPTRAWTYTPNLIPATPYRTGYAPVTVRAAYLPVPSAYAPATQGCSTCSAYSAAYGGCSTCGNNQTVNYAPVNYGTSSYAAPATGCSSCGVQSTASYGAAVIQGPVQSSMQGSMQGSAMYPAANGYSAAAPATLPSTYEPLRPGEIPTSALPAPAAGQSWPQPQTQPGSIAPPANTVPSIPAPGSQRTFRDDGVRIAPPAGGPASMTTTTTSAWNNPAATPAGTWVRPAYDKGTAPIPIVPAPKIEGLPPVDNGQRANPANTPRNEGDSKVTARPVYQAGYYQAIPAAIPAAAVDNQWRHFEP